MSSLGMDEDVGGRLSGYVLGRSDVCESYGAEWMVDAACTSLDAKLWFPETAM